CCPRTTATARSPANTTPGNTTPPPTNLSLARVCLAGVTNAIASRPSTNINMAEAPNSIIHQRVDTAWAAGPAGSKVDRGPVHPAVLNDPPSSNAIALMRRAVLHLVLWLILDTLLKMNWLIQSAPRRIFIALNR